MRRSPVPQPAKEPTALSRPPAALARLIGTPAAPAVPAVPATPAFAFAAECLCWHPYRRGYYSQKQKLLQTSCDLHTHAFGCSLNQNGVKSEQNPSLIKPIDVPDGTKPQKVQGSGAPSANTRLLLVSDRQPVVVNYHAPTAQHDHRARRRRHCQRGGTVVRAAQPGLLWIVCVLFDVLCEC